MIALAIAAAAPAAFAATSNVDVYGQVRVSVDSVDNDNIGYTVNDRVSRIGVKGTEDLGGGLTAIWQWETGLAVDGSSQIANDGTTSVAATGGVGTQRNTFVGVKGSFGTVLAGTHDTPYKLAGSADVFGDTAADSQKHGGIIGRNALDVRANNAVAYITPDYNGFHAAVAVIPNEAAATGGANAGRSIALVYANGPLKATFGQEKYHAGREGNKFNVSYKIGDIGLGATYEKSNSVSGAAKDKAYLVSATYGMGPITLAAQYGNFNDQDDSNNAAVGNFAAASGVDIKRSTVGAIYTLSKRTNAAVAYNNDDKSNGSSADTSTKTWTVQLNHSF